MFDLDFIKSIKLEQHEALLRRIIPNHPKRPEIEENIRKLRSGYRGEQTLHYFLSLLPPKKYHIFHNLRLPIGKSFFEIDAFLLSPKLSLIIGCKNHSGTLLIEKNQMTQTFNENVVIYSNPLSQANRHKILLRYWFEKNQLPIIPAEHLVCISNSSTAIKIIPGYTEAEKRVFKADHLLQKLEEYEKYYKNEVVDQKTLGKIRKALLHQHTPLISDILKEYSMDKNEIVTGVQCPKCYCIPILHKGGRKWECPTCHTLTIDAHIPAINDYFLLIKPSFSNSEFRHFLQLPSERTSAYLLNLLNLPSEGQNKGRIYHQPPKNIPFYSNHVFPKPNKQ